MVIKRISAVSCAKIMGLLYAVIGFLIGSIAALVFLAGGLSGWSKAANPFTIFGVAAVILFPIFYGIIGFIGTWIAASIYNVLAGVVGGVRVEVTAAPGSNWNSIEGVGVPSI